jgi:hypothetical protein
MLFSNLTKKTQNAKIYSHLSLAQLGYYRDKGLKWEEERYFFLRLEYLNGRIPAKRRRKEKEEEF